MTLERYRQKRDFAKTPEPAGKVARSRTRALSFVIQKHAATRLHYDFRLELDGTLKSWAVPKGPSMDPADRRLAVHVEDHPLEYARFEGTIPEREYGAGHVVVWDRGTWEPIGDPRAGYRDGNLKFRLHGEKLEGGWALVRMGARAAGGKENWLLIKERDDTARRGEGSVMVDTRPESVLSKRTLEDIAAGRHRPARKRTSARAPAAAPAATRDATHATGTGQPGASDRAAVVAGITITHPDRVLYPEANVTKLDVARYYERIHPLLAPFIENRPLSLVRCPQGPAASCFFQKHATAREIPGITYTMITESGGRKPYVIARTPTALAGLAQMGTIELHGWNARADDVERADTLVLDFDPDPNVEWSRVIDAALECRALLDALDLACFVKTSGGKGLHVVVPLARRVPWERAKAFARGIAEAFVARAPDRYIATASKQKRSGRIFVDFLRNARGATAVLPYSLRARHGATVATPLAWHEVTPDLAPAAFTLRSIDARLAARADPWAGYGTTRQTITLAMERELARRRERGA